MKRFRGHIPTRNRTSSVVFLWRGICCYGTKCTELSQAMGNSSFMMTSDGNWAGKKLFSMQKPWLKRACTQWRVTVLFVGLKRVNLLGASFRQQNNKTAKKSYGQITNLNAAGQEKRPILAIQKIVIFQNDNACFIADIVEAYRVEMVNPSTPPYFPDFARSYLHFLWSLEKWKKN